MDHQYHFKDADQNAIIKWEVILEALSSERVEPFLLEMGLYFIDSITIRRIARRSIKELMTLNAHIEKEKEVLQQMFQELEDQTSVEDSQKFYQWGNRIVRSNKGEKLYFWNVLLCWLAGIHNTHIPVIKPNLDENIIEAIVRFVKGEFADEFEVEQRVSDAKTLPASPWERQYYINIADEFDPLTVVSNIINDNKTLHVLDFIQEVLSESEIQELIKWAKSNAELLGFKGNKIIPPY